MECYNNEEVVAPVEESKPTKPFSCEAGKTYKEDCNTCICNEQGTNAACTMMGCLNSDNSHVNKRSTDQGQNKLPLNSPGYKCKPGSRFKDDCNSCICNNKGNAAECTLAFCAPQKIIPKASPRVKRNPKVAVNTPGFKCTPNAPFKDDCNTCICNGLKRLFRSILNTSGINLIDNLFPYFI